MTTYRIRSPSLPIQPNEYDRSQMDQFQNALRLYFNRLDQYNIQSQTEQNSMNVMMWLGGPGGC
jgi:hypothetical protein